MLHWKGLPCNSGLLYTCLHFLWWAGTRVESLFLGDPAVMRGLTALGSGLAVAGADHYWPLPTRRCRIYMHAAAPGCPVPSRGDGGGPTPMTLSGLAVAQTVAQLE